MSRFKMPNPNPFDDEKVIKGIVYSKPQWDRVLGHITKKEQDRRHAEMTAQEKQDRLQLSRQMAATWDNTLVVSEGLIEMDETKPLLISWAMVSNGPANIIGTIS